MNPFPKQPYSLKASALLYALLIAVLVGLTASALIAFASLSNKTLHEIEKAAVLRRNVNSGINCLLALSPSVAYDTVFVTDLYEEEKDSLQLSIEQWGVFKLLKAVAFQKKDSIEKTALAGVQLDPNQALALYLSEQKKPLVVAGNTQIKGHVFLPESGVKRGEVDRRRYESSILVEGKIRQSNPQLPALHVLPKWLKALAHTIENSNNTAVLSALQQDSIYQPFAAPALVLFSPGDVYLGYKNISGHVVIMASHEVVVEASTKLEDVIIYAKKLHIKSGFQGSLQAFVLNEVTVEPGVVLEYPSSLVLPSNKTQTERNLRIGHGASIHGIVAIDDDLHHPSKKPLLNLEKDAQINGQGWVNGVVATKGDVLGTLYCKSFLLKTQTSLYQNHLLDVNLDATQRSGSFSGIAIGESSPPLSIAKWTH